jgi:hypothetical protein
VKINLLVRCSWDLSDSDFLKFFPDWVTLSTGVEGCDGVNQQKKLLSAEFGSMDQSHISDMISKFGLGSPLLFDRLLAWCDWYDAHSHFILWIPHDTTNLSRKLLSEACGIRYSLNMTDLFFHKWCFLCCYQFIKFQFWLQTTYNVVSCNIYWLSLRKKIIMCTYKLCNEYHEILRGFEPYYSC